METQAPKRLKRKHRFEDFLGIYFGEKSKWIMVYFLIALDCDSPILEALLFTSFADTKVSRIGLKNNDFLESLIKLIADKIQKLHPRLQYRREKVRQWHWRRPGTTTKFVVYFLPGIARHKVVCAVIRRIGTLKTKTKFKFVWRWQRDIRIATTADPVPIRWLCFLDIFQENMNRLLVEFST